MMLKESINRSVVKYGNKNAIIIPEETEFLHKDAIRMEQIDEYTLMIKKLRAI